MCYTLAFIAQLVERCTCNAKVSGSIPDGGIFNNQCKNILIVKLKKCYDKPWYEDI